MLRPIAAAAIVVVLSFGALTSPSATAATPSTVRSFAAASRSTPSVAAYESRVVKRTNHRRATHDRVALHRRACVTRYAERWARHMARTETMVHQHLTPILRACGLRLVGENIAYGYPTAKSVVRAWMASPGHRANILTRRYRQIGVGAARDSHGVMWVSQVFGRRA